MDFFGATNQDYTVVARKQSGVAAERPDGIDKDDWRWSGAAPDKENFVYEWGEQLNPKYRYLCVPITDSGLDFDNIEWSITPDKEEDPEDKALRAVNRRLEDFMESHKPRAGDDVSLTDVDDHQQLQARLEGVIAQQGLQVADDVDDVVQILDAVGKEQQPTGNPMFDMMTDAENNLEISSPSDLAVMMMMPEMKDIMDDGRDALSTFSELAGGGSAAGSLASSMMGGGDDGDSQDTVELSRDDYEALREEAGLNDTRSSTDGPIDEPDPGPDPSSESSFDMGDYVDEEADTEPVTDDPDRQENTADDPADDPEPNPEPDPEHDPMTAAPTVDVEAGEVTPPDDADDTADDATADSTEVDS